MSKDNFDNPEYYTNRELSWLGFNERVLEEAQDPTNPLLERIKFLAIVSSNLDEFFEIRVSGIKQQIESHSTEAAADGLSPHQTFNAIKEKIHWIVSTQYELWTRELQPELTKNGVEIVEVDTLSEKEQAWAKDFFMNEVFPVLTPLAIDPSHPFPQLLNKSLNLLVHFQRKGGNEVRHAVVQLPRSFKPLILLPNRPRGKHSFILLSNLISTFISQLFPSATILGVHRFRITRNSDLYIDDEEALSLLSSIEEQLQKRNRGNAVRLEIPNNTPEDVINYLLEKCELEMDDVYLVDGPVNLTILMGLMGLDVAPHLTDKPHIPVTAAPLQGGSDIFEVIRKRDIILHHPYEGFGSVVEFVEKSANDPRVLAIKMTLYRTSGDSPIVKALIDAAKNEKQVTVLVELKARFDEANNIAWARRMEEAGVHVVYGLVGLKTHCKTLLVVRRDEDQIRHYAHLGTGNYHPKTARLYTDVGMLTSRKRITNEVANLFNTLTGMAEFRGFQKLLVAPFDLAPSFIELIETETANAKLGLPARIFAKMNSLVDEKIIRALYAASCAGVKVELIIRGICCLRPGIKGVSENIRCISIVDRFLEHSRIFYFENAGSPKLYMGSADWMPRNLYRRVEVVFPVEEKNAKARVIDEIIGTFLKDNVKAREFTPDGSHRRIKLRKNQQPFRSQTEFIAIAEQSNAPITKVIPSTQAPVPIKKITETE